MPDIFDTIELPTKKRDVFDQIDIFDTIELPEEVTDIPLADAEPALPPAPVFKPKADEVDPNELSNLFSLYKNQEQIEKGLDETLAQNKYDEQLFIARDENRRLLTGAEDALISKAPKHPVAREIRAQRNPVYEEGGLLFDTKTDTPLPAEDPRVQQFLFEKQNPGAIKSAAARFSGAVMGQMAGLLRNFAPSNLGADRLAAELGEQAAMANATAQLNQETGAKLLQGVAGAGGLILGNPANKIGLVTGALRAGAEAEEGARAAGLSHGEAAFEGQKATALLPVYMGGSLLAGRLGGALAAESGPIAQGVVGAGAATAGNIGISSALAAAQDHPYTVENLGADVAFGALGGFHQFQQARNKVEGLRTDAVADVQNLLKAPEGEERPMPSVSSNVPLAASGLERPLTREQAFVAATQGLDAVRTVPPESGTLEAGYREAGGEKPSLEEIRQQGSIPPDPNRQLGPGAANIEEPLSTFVTSNKEAVVNAERAAIGQDPVVKEARISNAESIDRAETILEQNPTRADEIVSKLRTDPQAREISLEDSAVLLVNRASLKSRQEQALERITAEDTPPEERAAAEAEFQFLDGKLAELDQAAQDARSTWGRFGQLWQRSMRSDMTLEPMLARARIAKGEPLTPAERTAITQEADTIQKAEAGVTERTAAVDETQSTQAAQQAINKESRYHPRVLEYAEGIVSRWETEAVKAKADLMSLMGIASANPFQTKAINALFKMARAKVARGALNAADFATEMVQTFGEKVRPFIQPAWEKAQKFVTGLDAAKRPKTKKQVAKEAAGAEEAASTEAGITAAAEGGSTLDALKPYVKRLAKDYIKSGVNTVEGLQTKLHDFFSKILPDVTPRQLRDIFSDYGTGKPAPTDPVRVTASQLRGESQKLSALEDLTRQLAGEMEKTGVPPSGDKRVPQSDRARSLTKKINELKKELGIVEGDPAKRLASALESLETRTSNRIRDLKFEIAKGERTVKQRGEQPTSPKLEALRKELAEVQAEHEAVFGKREVTPEQRLKAAIAAAERAEKQAVEDVQNARKGIFRERPAPGKANAELEALRARTKAARAAVNELKGLDLAQQAKAEQQAINQRKTQLAKRAADYADRVAKGDFEPRKRKELDISKDPEAVRLKAEAKEAKANFAKKRFEWEQAKRSRTRKVIDTAKDVLASTRTLITSGDVSAPFRQGGFLLLGDLAFNPKRAVKQIGKMFHVMASEKGFNEAEAALRLRPNAGLYEQSGLHLSDPHGKFTQREENMRSNLAEQIPLAGRVVKGSNRAYAGFLNRQRADAFDAFVEMLGGKSRVTPDEATFLAKAVNDLSGRSDLSSGKAIGVADWLAKYLFSPRFLLSRFKTIVGAPIFRDIGNPNISLKARSVVALQYAKFAAGLAALYGLAKLSGAEVELDPRSSDFGKAKFGNTRIDAMAGLQQVAVFLSRMFSGKTKTAKGDIKSIRVSDDNAPKFGDRTAVDVAATFGRSKLAPLPAAGVDWLQGMTMDFERPTLLNTAQKLTVPIGYQDAPAIIKEQGFAKGAVIEALNLLGMGVQHYEPRKR